MSNDLGKAYIQIVPTVKDAHEEISKGLGLSDGSLGKSAGINIGSALKKAFIGLGIGTALKESIFQGADLEQNLGGTEAVFGSFAQSIQNSAKDAYTNMGLSASDYMATANKMGSLFQGSGLSQQRSLDLTSAAMQRAADVVSVMGIDTSMAMESIAGAAKGNFTMMDNLGVAMNATTLQAYALEKGVNFNWNTASNAEKAELAMKMFMDRTSQYQGNFARESEETFSGSLGAMKAAGQNLMANLSLGQSIGPELNNLLTTVSNFAFGNLIPMVQNVATGIIELLVAEGPKWIEQGLNMLTGLSEGFISAFPNMSSAVMDVLENIAQYLTENVPIWIEKGFEILSNLVDGIFNAMPEMIARLPQIITTFTKVINDNFPTILAKGAELIVKLVSGIISMVPHVIANMPAIIEAIWNTILAINWLNLGKTIINFFTNGIKGMIGMVKSNASSIVNSIKERLMNLPKDMYSFGKNAVNFLSNGIKGMMGFIRNNAGNLVNAIKGKIAELPSHMVNIGKNLVKGIWNGITNVKNWILGKIKGFTSSILDGIKGFFGIHSPSRVMDKEVGRMLPAGMAQGIDKNIGLVEKAMDEMNSIGMNTMEQNVGLGLNASYSGLDESLLSNNHLGLEVSTQPAYFNFILGGTSYKAFVSDITDEQNKATQFELSF